MKTAMTSDTAQVVTPDALFSADDSAVFGMNAEQESNPEENSKKPILMGLGITAAMILLIILGMDLLAFAQGGEKQDFGGPAVGEAAPDFSADTLAGAPFTMSENQGKPVMLTFWSPGCPACVSELPVFDAIANDESIDVTMISIALDATPAEVTELMEQSGVSFPVIANESGDIARQYNLRYIPFSVFINPDGTVDENMSPERVSGEELHTELKAWLKTCSGESACAIQ